MSTPIRGPSGVLIGLLLLSLSACRSATTAPDSPDARESPQASAEPAQLAALPTTQKAAPSPILVSSEGGPPPSPLRGDEVLAPDALARESPGYTLSALFRQVDVMGPTRSPEVNAAGLDTARRATELRLGIDLLPTRLRMGLLGRGFVVAEGTEIRARSDRYGHVVVWPGSSAYRPLAPGSLRAFLGERRFDVAPITPAAITAQEEIGRRIGIRTRKVEVTTRAARATFEVGRLEGAGDGGVLLCRLLLDLMNAPPDAALCADSELPVRAELRWTNHGALVFELTGHLRRTDLALAQMLVPPPTASYTAAPLDAAGVTPLLTGPELAAFRTGDVETPSARGDALLLTNASLELRVFYLDGVAIAWAGPGGRGEIRGLHRGRYVGQWRTFLGDVVETALTQTVPGTTQVGTLLDAGH